MRLSVVIRNLDWVSAAAMLLLVFIGLAMVLSAAYTEDTISPLFIRQTIALLVGVAIFLFIAKVPYHVWQGYAPSLYAGGVALLVLVTIVGAAIRGTVSRLAIFGFQIQPSEYMKVGFIIFLAWFMARYHKLRVPQLLISAAIVGIPIALIIREPDFGMAALLITTYLATLVVVGLPWRYLIVISLIGTVAALGTWQWLLYDYQKARIQTFLTPESDPLSSGYNVTQSIIAFGSGRVFGRGLGHGPQSQLKFLPERHTDFILASIGEELGFVGVTTVLILYAIILWRIIKLTEVTQDRFGQILLLMIFIALLTSLSVSAGMNMGLLPVTGIPLPLVSYGGSSLITTMILLGLVQSVHLHSHFVRKGAPDISVFT